jgi:ribose transport system permease protein
VICAAYMISRPASPPSRGGGASFCTPSRSHPRPQGNFYELYAIAAAVLGGFSLRGGEGSIIGVILGTILLQELQNLVNLLGIPSSLNFAVMGGVILIGVLVDQQWNAFRARRSIVEAARTPSAATPPAG